MKVMVISAHADDETIGAGGTLMRHIDQGDQVWWVVVTRGYSPPWSEAAVARAEMQMSEIHDFYGFQETFRLGFPTVKLNTVPYMELSSAITRVVKQVNPEVVYTLPKDDINQDHRIVHDCTLVATRPFPGSSVRRVLSYEISATCGYGIPSGGAPFHPTVYVDISAYLERKLAAMRIFETEVQPFPHPRSPEGLELMARERGLRVGYSAAEAFELVRERIGPDDRLP